MKNLLRAIVFLFLLPFLSLLDSNVSADAVLSLLSPNGGEVIQSGGVYTIQWEAPSEAVKFNLRYSIDNGLTWNVIGDNVTGTSYDWYIPAFTENENNCRIRITGHNSSGEIVGDDVSNMAFSIEAGI